MTERLETDQPRRLLVALQQLVADRAAAEVDLVSAFRAQKEAAERQYQEAREQAAARHEREKADTEAEYGSMRSAIVARFQSDHSASEDEYDRIRSEIVMRFGEAELAERKRLQDARWQAGAVFEATKQGLDASVKETKAQLEAQDQEFLAVRQEAVQLLRRRRQWRDGAEPQVVGSPTQGDPIQRRAELVAAAKSQLRGLQTQTAARLFEGGEPLGIAIVVVLAALVLAGLVAGWSGWYWIPAGGALGIFAAAGLLRWIFLVAKRQSAEGYREILQTLADAEVARRAAMAAVEARSREQSAASAAIMNAEIEKAEEAYTKASARLAAERQEAIDRAGAEFSSFRSTAVERHNRELRELEERYSQRQEEIDALYRSETSGLDRGYSRAMAEREARFQHDCQSASSRWLEGIQQVQAEVDEMNRTCDRLFPPWNAPAWARWTPAPAIPSAIPFGRLEFKLSDLEGGVPADRRLMPPQTDFSIPVPLGLRDHSLLLLKAEGDGRALAVAALQSMMLRMLTAIPPGKVRFVIVDPAGLGENFSAFMHLADYNEQLISNRIWTESGHIERRLAELTEHMENVLQVYLRNEFQSVQEYNESAGELAEPYRVLVVANFPAGFSEVAARRLLSIVASGARCGVYTLMSLDTRLPLPRDFRLADLERHAVKLKCDAARSLWEHPELGPLPVVLGGPPDPEQFTEIVRRVGREAQDADRIELPFEWVIPEERQWWTAESRSGVDVPLGRSGVTKLQHLQLGRGTSQHVLLAGKTGSGKSTLLHVLIVNLALRYSPDEVELYLVDFKKGVEFKAYAETGLPHARVIAIESEREFGLSVLERLDLELKRRGDLFREHGVQDLHGFRAANPDVKLPRVLLIIDEFQELFVEDDRIAQSAVLLLDRLVRQGRAFGIHVLLGSQTLAGAYSIPRSTIGQMAVRIALQCSEADAHLILSEENTAARLLTRPGEAIYNDANGLYEGNHPFQVVWLPDEQRERYLQRLREWALERNYAPSPAIVFEGNLPADPGKNPALHGLLAAPAWPGDAPAVKAWLGSPVSIKEPTAAVFVRQGGSNLLVVGHNEEEALGILATGLLSLAAQHAPGDPGGGEVGRISNPSRSYSAARFYVLDGTRPDVPQAGYWGRLASVVPHQTKVAPPRGAAGLIAEIAAELERRESSGQDNAPPIYLVIHDLARFRDFRKAEDDFGFSRSDEGKPASPAQQFRTILREGPALGIHALMWADSYTTAVRTVDRQGLEDVEMRVALRMNAGDSSSLIDSPLASQLGIHRAIFDDQSQGRLEKFRPYGPPSSQWLDWVHTRLHERFAAEPRTPVR